MGSSRKPEGQLPGGGDLCISWCIYNSKPAAADSDEDLRGRMCVGCGYANEGSLAEASRIRQGWRELCTEAIVAMYYVVV